MNICAEIERELKKNPLAILEPRIKYHLATCKICSTRGEGKDAQPGEWQPKTVGTYQPELPFDKLRVSKKSN